MDVDDQHDPANDSDDSMPSLQSVSNSSDSDGSSDSGDEQDRRHVHAAVAEDDGDSAWTDVDDDDMPRLEPTAGSRRPRVDDDQDQDRDRRHPSQRVTAPPQPAPPPPTEPHNHNHTHPHPPHVHPNPGNPHLPPPPLAQLLTFLTRGGPLNVPELIFGPDPPPPKDSPVNAARIIAGLAAVPEGLIRRLERVSAAAGGAADDVGAVGGDSGCAICWDRLLDGDGAEFAAADSTATATGPAPDPVSTPASESTTPASASEPKDPLPPIIALPCAHVFHAACLGPWFARPGQTTCPTCRFDLDPTGLIWYGGRKGPRRGGGGFDLNFDFAAGAGPGLDMPARWDFAWGPETAVDEDGDGEPFDGDGMDEEWGPEDVTLDFFGTVPPQDSNDGDEDDEGEGDDTMPALEPIPGHAPAPAPAAAAPAAAGEDHDMPPLEPTSGRAPPPAAPAAPAPTAPAPPTNAAATTPPTNATAPPPRAPDTFTFGLDIVFRTLGPIPPPADLGGATAPGVLGANPALAAAQAQAHTGGPGPPAAAAGGQPPPAQPQGAPGQPPAGAQTAANFVQAFGPFAQFMRGAGVGGVGLGAAGGGAGGMGPAFPQLFRGFGAPSSADGPAASQAQGGAGGDPGVPPNATANAAPQQAPAPAQGQAPGGDAPQTQPHAHAHPFNTHAQHAPVTPGDLGAAFFRALNGAAAAAGLPGTGGAAEGGGGGDFGLGALFGGAFGPHDVHVTLGAGMPPWMRPAAGAEGGAGLRNADGTVGASAAERGATGAGAGAGAGQGQEGDAAGAGRGARRRPTGAAAAVPGVLLGFGVPAQGWNPNAALPPPPPTNANPAATTANANPPPPANPQANPAPPLFTGPTHVHTTHFHAQGVPPAMFHGMHAPTGAAPAPYPPPPPPPTAPMPEWAAPPAPGPTLRDRVERREREAGLRCSDASCGVGPSDEDPFVAVPDAAKHVVALGGCEHTFHPSCLVSAQRARGGWREPVLAQDGERAVEVVCSLCRAEGKVPQAEWLAGCILPLD